MNAEQRNKINKLLLSATPKGLLFSDWLKKNGYSDQLIKRYRESGWLAMLSKGVMYRKGDNLSAYVSLACYNRQRVPEWMRSDVFDKIIKPFFTDTFSIPQVTTINSDETDLMVSIPEQAFLECLLLVPQQYSYIHGSILYNKTNDNATPRKATTTA